MRCPRCNHLIEDHVVVSASQAILGAAGSPDSKARSSNMAAKAARARWKKYWDDKGGRPANYSAYKKAAKKATKKAAKATKKKTAVT